MQRILVLLPILVVAVLGAFLVWGLNPERDPNAIPSARISKPAPDFDLPQVVGVGVPGLATADLSGAGTPVVLNVFASWCVPCRAEHKVLTRLAREGDFTLVGINYKDKPEDALRWLRDLGNPYVRIGADQSGRAGIEWGISGVPETFVINSEGIVTFRFVGPIATEQAQNDLREAVAEAAQ